MKGDLNLSGRAFGGHLDQNAPHGGQVSFGGAKEQHCLYSLMTPNLWPHSSPPMVSHGCLHPAHHEEHVVRGEGGEQEVGQLAGGHHGEPGGKQ